MARQFRIDDTNKWSVHYGNGTAGAVTMGSNETMGTGRGAYYGTLTASNGATTANTNLGNGTYNMICMIHQTKHVSGASGGGGNWEYNFLISVSGGIATFLLPFTQDFTSGAQIVTALQYSNITVNGNLYAPGWNGSTGGIGFLVCNNTLNGSGNLLCQGATAGCGNNCQFNPGATGGGFWGGKGDSINTDNFMQGGTGEGYDSRTPNGPQSGVDQGGWGAVCNNNPNGQAGAGGSNQTYGIGSAFNTGGGGQGGQVVGNQWLTNMHMGGGGQGGGTNCGGASGGSSGGGIWHVLGTTVDMTNIAVYLNGGATNTGCGMNGGGGAGGSFLGKGLIFTVGFVNVQRGYGRQDNGGQSGAGSGGDGWARVDYGRSIAGNIGAVYYGQDKTLDPMLLTGFI